MNIKKLVTAAVTAVTGPETPKPIPGTLRIRNPDGSFRPPDPHLEPRDEVTPTAPASETSTATHEAKPARKAEHLWCVKELTNRPEIVKARKAVVDAQTKFRARLTELSPLLQPEAEIAKLTKLIAQERDIDVISSAQRKIGELTVAGAAAKSRGHSLAAEAHSEFEKAVIEALDVAEVAAREILASAITAESKFLAGYSLSHEPTEASLSVRKHCLGPIDHHKRNMEHARHIMQINPYSHMTVLQFLDKK